MAPVLMMGKAEFDGCEMSWGAEFFPETIEKFFTPK